MFALGRECLLWGRECLFWGVKCLVWGWMFALGVNVCFVGWMFALGVNVCFGVDICFRGRGYSVALWLVLVLFGVGRWG